MFDVFSNEDFIKKLTAKNQTLAKRLANHIGELVQKIREAVKMIAVRYSNPEIKALMNDAEKLDTIRNMLLEGYKNASENFKVEQAEGQKNNADVTAVKSSKQELQVIDLTDDNDLSVRLENKYGSERYKTIRDYILTVLKNQPIKLSDGKNAVVDKRDAIHIANKSYTEKTVQIAKIKELVENAELYAEDVKVEHEKFNYFCYYKANVKYRDETYPIYLNVGKAKNDGKYHIYDITKKLRDTANRINGFERPKPNEGYAPKNDVSTNSIPKTIKSVKQNLSVNDAEYLEAVENGDTETAQRLVDETAETWSNGNRLYTTDNNTGEIIYEFYRSADGGRTIWNGHGNNQAQGVFLTSNKYIANAFDPDGKHITVYAKAENPFEIDASGEIYTAIPVDEDDAPEWLGDIISYDVVWSDRENDYVTETSVDIDNLYPAAFEQGYDAVIVKNVKEGVGGGIATDVVLKDGGVQMKSADPVTYDNNGEVIPLSERFKESDVDIRYSMKQNDFSYDELIKKPDMKVTKLTPVSEEKLNDYIKDHTLFCKEAVRKAREKNNTKNTDTQTWLSCNDVNKDIMISIDSFRHSAQRITSAYVNISMKLGDILENAIAVNELSESPHAKKSTVLLGTAYDDNSLYFVRMIVDSREWKLKEYDILYAITKEAKKIEDVGVYAPEFQLDAVSRTSSKISIYDLLQNVKDVNLISTVISEDVSEKLEIERPFDKKLSPSLIYSRKSDTSNLSELKSKRSKLADEYRELKSQIDEIKSSAEYKAFDDEVRTVRKNGSRFGGFEAVKEIRQRQKQWAESAGLSALEERFYNISEQLHDYDLEIYKLDKAQKEKVTAELTDKVKKFSHNEVTEYVVRAAQKFGITNKFDNAGYMLTNGNLLDFSDGQGYRVLDHREIRDVLDFLPENGNRSDGLIQFMNMGNIRMQIGGIDISKAPNKQQIPVLREFFNKNNGEITVDFSKENGDNAGSIEYLSGTKSEKILNDIKIYFEKGTLPQISSAAVFHAMYSVKQTDPIQAHYAEVMRENRNLRNIISALDEMQYSSARSNIHLSGRDIHNLQKNIFYFFYNLYYFESYFVFGITSD